MLQSFAKIKKIKGELTLPGDKSISHRSLIFSAMGKGRSIIQNLPNGEDVQSTIYCLSQLGVNILETNNLAYVDGRGFKGFQKPVRELFAGNSGTTARLLSGLLSVQDFPSIIIGDTSLSKRPMLRVIEPLRQMGADISSQTGTLPLRINPSKQIKPIDFQLITPSAQVKSAVILAGLHPDEETSITEYLPSRDHTERMLNLRMAKEERKNIIYVSKKDYPQSNEYIIPADISSAVFFITAALITPGSELLIKNVSLNPSRTAILDIFRQMGGSIEIENRQSYANEPSGDLIIKTSGLKNVVIPPEIIPNIIDEIPALTIAGIFAEGEFSIAGAEELRHKETDRISAVCSNLKGAGIGVEEYIDGFSFTGKKLNRNLFFNSFGDHRIAMAFSILSMLSDNGGIVEDFQCISISNPDFINQINSVGSF
jgi:3-phosphoshikimate 1-carboxyvinyltransferase